MKQLQEIRHWFYSLTQKEQWIIFGTVLFVIITMFFLIVWEPLHLGLNDEKQKQATQNKSLTWMQQASTEVRSLRSSGSSTNVRDKNKPTTLVIEQSINNAGLKPSVNKIESSGNNGARATLTDAPFNQILVWMSTLAKHNGIHVISANIERASAAGKANARLTFERP
jgi:general secretion pathway protein M